MAQVPGVRGPASPKRDAGFLARFGTKLLVDGCQVEGGLGISESAPKGTQAASGAIFAPDHIFVVGDTFHYAQLVDDALVRGYADVTGDHNKIHVDDAFAKTTIFGQRIAHGGILFGMISKVLGDDMPGIGTIYMDQSISFHAPVFINDTVSLQVTVTTLLPKHVAKIGCVMKKQTGQVVVDGVATVKLPGWLIKQHA